MSVVKLPVSGCLMTLVDPDIAKKLEGKNLYRVGKCGIYACFSHGGKYIQLHRFVMNNPKGMLIDHLNGNTLDNRRCNLRVCNYSENGLNRRVPTKASSGYRLVYEDHCTYRFRIATMINLKQKHIASFRSRHVAGIFADMVLVKNVGPFVKRNFPEKIFCSSLIDFLNSTSGRIFKVVFSRRTDGRQREMLCRTGVKADQNGGIIPFNPISKNLFSVYDVQKKAYRFIPLENVICIRYAKTNYRIVA